MAGKYQKGQSGNPNGRPPKSRALTEILSKAGAKSTTDASGMKMSGRRLLARLLWEGITSSSVTFPNGVKFDLSPSDWLALTQFLYRHIDGPPPQALDVTSGGQPITIRIVDESAGKDE